MRSFSVRCEYASVVTLREIAKLWPSMTAAQQSNLMWRALDVSTEMDPRVYKSLPKHVVHFDANLNDVDVTRLKQLGGLWCEIAPSMQQELLDQVQDCKVEWPSSVMAVRPVGHQQFATS